MAYPTKLSTNFLLNRNFNFAFQRYLASLLDKALNGLTRLDELYSEAETKWKREIISSMYPEKLTFTE